jgi:FlaA1/EpsC-like NDP-sugar epimerase
VDIKRAHKLAEVFARHRPEVVFDAAAYRHVPFMEANPDEAVLNNVVGTRELVETALGHGAGMFVLISTGKAVNPSSPWPGRDRAG